MFIYVYIYIYIYTYIHIYSYLRGLVSHRLTRRLLLSRLRGSVQGGEVVVVAAAARSALLGRCSRLSDPLSAPRMRCSGLELSLPRTLERGVCDRVSVTVSHCAPGVMIALRCRCSRGDASAEVSGGALTGRMRRRRGLFREDSLSLSCSLSAITDASCVRARARVSVACACMCVGMHVESGTVYAYVLS